MKFFLKKSLKTSYLENCKILSRPIQTQVSHPASNSHFSNPCSFRDMTFFGFFQNLSRKLQGFDQPVLVFLFPRKIREKSGASDL